MFLNKIWNENCLGNLFPEDIVCLLVDLGTIDSKYVNIAEHLVDVYHSFDLYHSLGFLLKIAVWLNDVDGGGVTKDTYARDIFPRAE